VEEELRIASSGAEVASVCLCSLPVEFCRYSFSDKFNLQKKNHSIFQTEDGRVFVVLLKEYLSAKWRSWMSLNSSGLAAGFWLN
jgi:hypothetical protein